MASPGAFVSSEPGLAAAHLVSVTYDPAHCESPSSARQTGGLTPERKVVAYPCRPSLEKGSASCLLIASVGPALAARSSDTVAYACRYPARGAERGSRTASLLLVLPRAIHAARAPEPARRTEPPTSDHPFATAISWRKEMTTCAPISAAAAAPWLPAVPAAPETLPKHLTSRCLTFSDPAQRIKATEKSPIYGVSPRPPPWVTIGPRKELQMAGEPTPQAGEQGRLAQRSFCAHFRRHRSRHQQLPAPGGAGVGRRLRSHRRLLPAGPAGRGSGAERVAVRRCDRAHLGSAGRLRVQDRTPPRQPRPPHRHRSLPPRLQRRGLPGPGEGAHRPLLRGHPALRGGAAGARELREPARSRDPLRPADRHRRRLDRSELDPRLPSRRSPGRRRHRAARHDLGAVGRRHPHRIVRRRPAARAAGHARLLRRHGRAHPRRPAPVLRQARHRRARSPAARSRWSAPRAR